MASHSLSHFGKLNFINQLTLSDILVGLQHISATPLAAPLRNNLAKRNFAFSSRKNMIRGSLQHFPRIVYSFYTACTYLPRPPI